MFTLQAVQSSSLDDDDLGDPRHRFHIGGGFSSSWASEGESFRGRPRSNSMSLVLSSDSTVMFGRASARPRGTMICLIYIYLCYTFSVCSLCIYFTPGMR